MGQSQGNEANAVTRQATSCWSVYGPVSFYTYKLLVQRISKHVFQGTISVVGRPPIILIVLSLSIHLHTYIYMHDLYCMSVDRRAKRQGRYLQDYSTVGTEQWQSSRDVHRKNATPPSTQRTVIPTQTTSETKVRRPLSILVIFHGVPVGTGTVSPNTVSRPSSSQRVS